VQSENGPLAQKVTNLITLSQFNLFHAEVQYNAWFSHQADSN